MAKDEPFDPGCKDFAMVIVNEAIIKAQIMGLRPRDMTHSLKLAHSFAEDILKASGTE